MCHPASTTVLALPVFFFLTNDSVSLYTLGCPRQLRLHMCIHISYVHECSDVCRGWIPGAGIIDGC